MEETTRLNKFIAECGVCSRREADKLIEEGRSGGAGADQSAHRDDGPSAADRADF